LNNLNNLADGGTCIAILPMQSALAQKGRTMECKQEILKKHTLEAVFSIPDELFFNSNVGVVSCVMVFTAHRPHPKNKETYFGYYKNDGFLKRKVQGRIDSGEWSSIKQKWIDSFLNRKSIDGLSVNKIVSPEDEWSTEAYLQTDYSNLEDGLFTESLLNYASYLFKNKRIGSASCEAMYKNKMQLQTDKWTSFLLTDLFEIKGSTTTSVLELEEHGVGVHPYVTTQATNNGVAGFYDFFTEQGNILTVDSAVLGYCSYQEFAFSASDHVEKLIPRFEMDKYIALFLSTIFNLERYRFNYGRKCSHARMKQMVIKLPVDSSGKPDWDFMSNYIKSLSYSCCI
jgi:hypothetical protein